MGSHQTVCMPPTLEAMPSWAFLQMRRPGRSGECCWNQDSCYAFQQACWYVLASYTFVLVLLQCCFVALLSDLFICTCCSCTRITCRPSCMPVFSAPVHLEPWLHTLSPGHAVLSEQLKCLRS